eukprot:g47739.t1
MSPSRTQCWASSSISKVVPSLHLATDNVWNKPHTHPLYWFKGVNTLQETNPADGSRGFFLQTSAQLHLSRRAAVDSRLPLVEPVTPLGRAH